MNPTEFFELLDKMTEEEQNKFMILIKGCTKRLNKIKDPLEVAYQAVLCGKENSNEVIFFHKCLHNLIIHNISQYFSSFISFTDLQSNFGAKIIKKRVKFYAKSENSSSLWRNFSNSKYNFCLEMKYLRLFRFRFFCRFVFKLV